jgi:hypothetical protein
MFSDVSLHVIYRIANATIRPFPFPHIFVQDVFPRKFYEEIRGRLPPKEVFTTLRGLGRVGKGYPDTRLVLPMTREDLSLVPEPFRGFWTEIGSWLLDGTFGGTIVPKFDHFLRQRFGDAPTEFYDEALLVQDYTTYSLGPHTDTPSKVLSFLFYLPADDSRAHLGTSIYVPKDPNFMCKGGPKYDFERFHRVFTMPYLPNTLFAFLKTDNAFHGVEPVTDPDARRDLLLYDVRVKTPELRPERQPTAPAAAGVSNKFSF